MNEFEGYLQELQDSLHGMSSEKQDEIMAEVEAHIEDGLADGRFATTPNKLRQELGSAEEMGRGITAVYTNRRWLKILILLLPYFILQLPFLFQISFEHIPSPAYDNYVTAYSILNLIIFAPVFYASLRLRSFEIGLWWASFIVARSLIPLLTAPIWRLLEVSGTDVNWQDWVEAIAISLPFFWLLWHVKHKALLLVFGTLPLTLGAVFQLYQLYETGFPSPLWELWEYRDVEQILRLFMWCGVVLFYFLAQDRWMRWLGIGCSIYIYLFGITFVILDLPRNGKVFVDILNGFGYDRDLPNVLVPVLITIWVWPVVIFCLGLLHEWRGTRRQPHAVIA
ncbi:MAG: hypothetical protein GY943_34100 [Chloroflexi bacterium]|nr:hypothetical protein [Chloroflexota bacterium]